MKVITFNNFEFQNACQKLACEVTARCNPDLVVGIKSGGAYVAKEMQKHFQQPARYIEVSLSRPSSVAKKTVFVSSLLCRLPRIFTDILRIIESWITFVRLAVSKTKPRTKSISLPRDIIDDFNRNKATVLVVDDAIDTGSTMKAVTGCLQQLLPDSIVLTAVITRTQPLCSVQPDFVLFNNSTLIRFPWASDYRK